jgi:nucleotide-binding universal stress UspA family protein
VADQVTTSEHRIVVGVDSSEGSKAALRWAIAQARRTGATVDAVSAWQDPVQTGYLYGYLPTAVESQGYVEIAQKVLDDTVSEMTDEAGSPVTVQARVIQGHPALVLPEAAIGAELLVVGSRGRGAFAGMLLGSVSQHCVQHPTCPVVVIPAPGAEHDS